MTLALVLALVAGGTSYIYLRGVQSRAYQNAKLTRVYVVENPIPRGTPYSTIVSGNFVKQSQIPNQFKPIDAVTDLATLQSEVAIANLTPGQVLSAGLFASQTAAASTTVGAIPKGDIAITVSVGSVQDVAGLVQPGDLVDVLIELNGTSERFLYQNALVLAVGTTVAVPANSSSQVAAASPAGTLVTSGLITFAVPPAAAARLAFVQSGGGGAGSLYLALVPPNNKPQRQPTINSGNLMPATVTP